MNGRGGGQVFSATYSNHPVYEYNVKGCNVMRRRQDDWINATHILKVADLDKPARTRVLEKEVQKDVHEKVQGGYGKYQGTWIPLDKAMNVAKKYNVYEDLRPLFDFVAGESTPPPAPKHQTAAASRARTQKPNANKRVVHVPQPPIRPQQYEDQSYMERSEQYDREDFGDGASTEGSPSMIDDDYHPYGTETGSRKRKRQADDEWHKQDQMHEAWGDALLDYFILGGDERPHSYNPWPKPPAGIDINRPIDNEGHTAVSWACAMGDTDVVKSLLALGADITKTNIRGETPLIRAGLFANCYDRELFPAMVKLLQDLIKVKDHHGATVFHHIAHTASHGPKAHRARHYLDVLLSKLNDMDSTDGFHAFLNSVDSKGDTAMHIAARKSKRCLKAFQHFGIDSNMPDANGETVDDYLATKARQRRENGANFPSSSPMTGSTPLPNGHPSNIDSRPRSSALPFFPEAYNTKSSQSFSQSFNDVILDKVQHFLSSGEDDLEGKESLLVDTNRHLNAKTADLLSVRQKTTELMSSNIEDKEGTANLQSERARLMKEAEAIEEQKQHRNLHSLVRREEERVTNVNGSASQDKTMEGKVEVARQLAEEQTLREKLTHELVECMAEEMMDEKGELYRQILCDTLNVGLAELPSLIEELVDDLADGSDRTTPTGVPAGPAVEVN